MKRASIITAMVKRAIREDVGSGDITALLIPETKQAQATIISREKAVICGTAWVDEVFQQIDPQLTITWNVCDGDLVQANQSLCVLQGPARSLVTGERCALNFLQTLSGTATLTHQYVQAMMGTRAKLLDTRKTIPGWRSAQKYAVTCGGGANHRMGLYDAFLIKENHILASGSITKAITIARSYAPSKLLEIEVENLEELQEALKAHADIILLDNFTLDQLKKAVRLNANHAKLEASGGVTLENIRAIAETGVDFISVGHLTKNIDAIDLSMRFT